MQVSAEISSVFDANDLKITNGRGFLTIEKNGISKIKTYFLSLFSGVGLILFAMLSTLDETFAIVGVVLIVSPLITQRFKAPHKLLIEEGNSVILYSGVSIARKIRLSDIASIEVDEAVINSDASPFKDGYQDFIYTFKIISSAKSRSLFSLSFRKESTPIVESVFLYLSKVLEVSETAKKTK